TPTDFATDLTNATSLAPLADTLFVADGPRLLRYRDADLDGLPDAPPEPVLTGTGNAHLIGLTCSPDGWLYGTQADGTTWSVEGRLFRERDVWRWHPVTRRLERVHAADDFFGIAATLREPAPSTSFTPLPKDAAVDALVADLAQADGPRARSAMERLRAHPEALRGVLEGEETGPAARRAAWALHGVEPLDGAELDVIAGWLAHPDEELRVWIAAEVAAPRIARLAAAVDETSLAAATQLVAAATDPATAAPLLLALDEAFRGRRDVPLPEALAEAIAAVPESDRLFPETQVRKLRLRLRQGDAGAFPVARGFLRYDDPQLEPLRLELLDALADVPEPTMLEPLIVLARGSQHAPIRRATLAALERFDQGAVAGRVLSFFRTSPEKVEICELLTRRPQWSRDLAEAVLQGVVYAHEVPQELVERMRAHGDAELDLQLRAVWGAGERSREALDAERTRVEGAAEGGDARRGGEVFRSACARCHGGPRAPRLRPYGGEGAALAAALVEPSAEVAAPYAAMRVRTRDGRLLTGRVLDETGDSITLEDPLRGPRKLLREAIATLEPSPSSPMPAGLTEALTESELADLAAWLRSDGR
ncbi:MAG: hypothetical protein AAF682_08290, partial [Planctomycetota bacterium]